jgi:hypothetical protein
LVVHGLEEDGEKRRDGRRLAGVHVGVEVHAAVALFREEINGRHALRDAECPARE